MDNQFAVVSGNWALASLPESTPCSSNFGLEFEFNFVAVSRSSMGLVDKNGTLLYHLRYGKAFPSWLLISRAKVFGQTLLTVKTYQTR